MHRRTALRLRRGGYLGERKKTKILSFHTLTDRLGSQVRSLNRLRVLVLTSSLSQIHLQHAVNSFPKSVSSSIHSNPSPPRLRVTAPPKQHHHQQQQQPGQSSTPFNVLTVLEWKRDENKRHSCLPTPTVTDAFYSSTTGKLPHPLSRFATTIRQTTSCLRLVRDGVIQTGIYSNKTGY